jgi:integrase
MGVYKICSHKGRARERCEHAWWGCYRRRRVSLAKWVGREIRGKAEATVVLEQMRAAIRSGTFDKRGAEPPRETTLEWLRIDAAGKPKPNNTAVFSNEVGEPVGCFKRAWTLTVLRAHGISPEWTREYEWKETSPECKRLLREIDLHWHDLRHEYASRLVERGVPLAQVRDLLGHASIKTTERYDCQTLENLQAAAARLDSGKTFKPGRPAASLPKPARQRSAVEQRVESAHSDASVGGRVSSFH